MELGKSLWLQALPCGCGGVVGGCCCKEVESGQWGRTEETQMLDRICCQANSLGDQSTGRITVAHGRAYGTEVLGFSGKADYHYIVKNNLVI